MTPPKKDWLWQAAMSSTIAVTAERAMRLKSIGEAVWRDPRKLKPEADTPTKEDQPEECPICGDHLGNERSPDGRCSDYREKHATHT